MAKEKMEFASQNFTAGQLNAIVKGLGGEEGAHEFLRGELTVKSSFNFTVCVDRHEMTIPYPCPLWGQLKHPELAGCGPFEYDLQNDVEQWVNDRWRTWSTKCSTVYKYLEETGSLRNCLDLRDGLAIQTRPIGLFRKVFRGEMAFLWRAVVEQTKRHLGYLQVPYLVERNGVLKLEWRFLERQLPSTTPVLRFRK